jgi:predicted secreted protein
MASIINGTNIVLYAKRSNAKYYFNAGVNNGTIASNVYYQLGEEENTGPSANLSKNGDSTFFGFITNIKYPGVTNIPAGNWTFVNYLDITFSLAYSPGFYYKIFKYNGTTLTLLATSSTFPFTANEKTKYTSIVSMPNVVLQQTDRIAIQIWTSNVDTRDVTLYTQGVNDSSVLTNLDYYTPFGASTNCSFETNVEQVEVTSQTSAWFREYKNDVITWSVTCDGFITLSNNYNYGYLLQLVLDKTPITVKFAIDNDNGANSDTLGNTVLTGLANLTSLSLSAPVEGASTYSVSLQGTGGYSIDGISVQTQGISIGTQIVKMLDYTATGGETNITFTDAIGFTCFSVSRGGVEVQTILTTGTATGNNVKFNTVTGVLTFGTALVAGEFVRALFK